MATVTLGGTPFSTSGNLPQVGEKAPSFHLTTNDLKTKNLDDYKGSKVIMNIFPSVDTSVCATSARTFNKEASELENTKVICISHDLPFAQARFCGAEGLNNVETLSDYKNGSFGKSYGVDLIDGPMETLHARAVVVLDENGTVKYTELVGEIAEEPNYKAALEALLDD